MLRGFDIRGTVISQILAARERVLGPEHPDTLESINNLAGLLRAKGDMAGAEPLFRRGLADRERVLGLEHPATLISVNNLANLLYAKGTWPRPTRCFAGRWTPSSAS